LTVSIDSTGLIWLGTYAAGINILNPSRTNFTHVLSKSDVVPFNGKNTIHGITKDMNENLWMADFGGGLYKLDLMTGVVSRPFQNSSADYRETIEYAYTLLVDVNNQLWIGAFEGLVVVDLNTQQILPLEFILNNQPFKFNDRVYQIYEDHTGLIWIATIEGLYVVESLRQEEERYVLSLIGKQPEIPHSYRDRSSRVSAILETRDGNLWLGGPSGLLNYSKKKDQWQHFEYHADNKQSLSNDDVQVIFEDSRGILWVGTGNGLNKVHRSDQDEIYFERITKDHGLPNNAIYGILEDSYKQLWLSTNLGLVKYSGQLEGMQSFRRYDGLSSDEFNTAAYYADSDGLLYFGSINGVTVVDSRVTTDLPKERELVFTRVQIGKRSLDVYALNHVKKPQIRMNKDESTIKISVADLFYQKLNTQSYRYRLLGLDEDWVSLGKERTFFLAGLKEGRYILDIQSKVGNEDWSQNNLRVELNVYADFFKSENMYYMMLLFSAVFIVTILFWIKRSYEQRINKAENLVKIESVRLKEAKKQIDELKSELENKAGELIMITDKFNDSSKLLDSYQFRDEISGFYRYQKMRDLFLQQYFGDKDSPAGFNLIAVLQLNGLTEIAERYGQVAAAEVVSHSSTELKAHSPAHIHICALKSDSFVILANTRENKDFTNVLINLRKKLIQSKIAIANDASISVQVSMSYLDLFPKLINDSSQLVNLCEVLIASHRSLNHVEMSGLMRVDLNCGVEELDHLTTASEIVRLIEGNTITYHFIE